eukprot:7449312-Pyramimonas_sp.AAC.1
MLPAYDWSVVRIYPRFLRLIGKTRLGFPAGGIATWTLKATGRLFHSGIPHHAINPIELNMEALAEIQRRFYQDFPPHPQVGRSAPS